MDQGRFPPAAPQIEGKILIAEAVCSSREDRTTWVGRMVKKGYMTASQAESEEDNLTGDQLDLQNSRSRKRSWSSTPTRQRQTHENAIKQAKVDERIAYANMESKRAVFVQQDALYKDLLDQIKQCKVNAPNSGIVVYSVPEQTRMGAGADAVDHCPGRAGRSTARR